MINAYRKHHVAELQGVEDDAQQLMLTASSSVAGIAGAGALGQAVAGSSFF